MGYRKKTEAAESGPRDGLEMGVTVSNRGEEWRDR
jgi:hypothetical protein